MTDNKKPHTAGTGTASKTAFNDPHSTKTDPLKGWYSLGAGVKTSRNDRTPKRGWKRNNRGRIDPLLAAHIGLLALAALLIVGGRYA